jgi:hypothetical protein
MQAALSKTAGLLCIIITLLASIAAAGGIWMKDLYHDNAFVKSAWFTNDIITLAVVVPLLLVAFYLARKGSKQWLMVLTGLVGYVFYNFAFYLFGAAFNIFFLIYTALFSLSAITLVLLLVNCGTGNITSGFAPGTPVKWISIYLTGISVMLFTVELSMIIPFLVSGIIPDAIKQTGHPTGVVFALDFSIVIPVSIIAAVLLWKRRLWGYIMGIIMLVKGFTYGLVLCVGTALLAYSDAYGKWDPLMPLYVIVALGGILGCWLLFKNFNDADTKKAG